MNIFEYIKSQLSILEVVGEYSKLKRAGMYWKGFCPFHNEKTPSFTVSPDRGIFYCFGCHANGDLISFIAKTENCSQIEAVKFLIDHYNISIPKEVEFDRDKDTIDNKKKYYEICKITASWFHNNLLKYPSVIKYLENRGINFQSIKNFMLGYFPSNDISIKNLINHLAKYNYLFKDLVEANILAKGKSVIYSSFEDRIIFPIKDHLGRFCGFGGRVYRDSDERAKYYNSKENSFFIKGSLLFGLDLAKKYIKDELFLVEGYTDCIVMCQHGYKNTVAVLGTACTEEHLKILSRYANIVYILYDNDNAGQNAILRLAELCWKVNLELRVIMLPTNEDPASFLSGNGSMLDLKRNYKDIFAFFIENTVSDFYKKNLSEKLDSIRRILDVVSRMNDSLKQDILLQKIVKISDIPFESLKSELKKVSSNCANKPREEVKFRKIDKLEKNILYAIIDNTHLLKRDNEEYLINYTSPLLKSILKKIKELKKKDGGNLNIDKIISVCDSDEKIIINEIFFEEKLVNRNYDFDYLFMLFQKKNWKNIVSDIKFRLESARKSKDDQKIKELLQKFVKLKNNLLGKGIKCL